ncbi:flagellar protein FlaG [Aeromonas caviae]|uniref:flagellar protein FlaG n=1 Tax=Aeromonas caviae TaxID=648 RepID=UPI001CC3C910|nr:flagellar protein FlaG [Aeromonas caviae]GJA87075.1 flagellin [Aeromonas caviae]GJA91134.1 flagellin [Aeromonas caviae]GJB08505.1 flagellin [Aeromonas caviae]GJB17170.1 flagellin [Aeromonas caviae]GJB29254.1 flagellin [Aeromonas caviae]
MANESIVMASTSTLTSHGGLRAAMPVSAQPASGVEQTVEQGSVDSANKSLKEEPLKATASSSKNNDETEKQAQELQERLSSLGQLKGWAIHFSLVPEFDRPVIQVIDAETRQVIRQIPSEEILQMNKRLQEMGKNQGDGPGLSGLLFDGQV